MAYVVIVNPFKRLGINPFKGIVETTKHPHAKTNRNSFMENFFETYAAINGNDDPLFGKPRNKYMEKIARKPGVLDWLTLFLEKICWVPWDQGSALYASDKKGKGIALMLLGLVPAIVALVLRLTKNIIAAALTFGLLSITGITHAVAKIVSKQDFIDLGKLLIYTQETFENKLAKIGDYFEWENENEHSRQAEQNKAKSYQDIIKDILNNHSDYQLGIKDLSFKIEGEEHIKRCITVCKKSPVITKIDYILPLDDFTDAQQTRALKALTKLNFFDLNNVKIKGQITGESGAQFIEQQMSALLDF